MKTDIPLLTDKNINTAIMNNYDKMLDMPVKTLYLSLNFSNQGQRK
jgi:hypothetical protein